METRSYRPKRSVRHAELEAQRPPRPPPRHEVARHRRERRNQRLVAAGAALIVLLVVLIPGYAYWRNVLHLGDEPVAVVGGQAVTVQDYARYLGTRQALLAREMSLAEAAVPTPAASPTTVAAPTAAAAGAATPVATPSAAEAAAQQTLGTLSNEGSSLSTTGLTDLVEAHLILNEARARNLTVSQAELDTALRWVLSPPPPGLQQGFGLEAVPSQVSGPGLISSDQAKQALTQIVGQGHDLSVAQFDDLILKPAVLKARLTDALAKNVPTSEEQVHARHILVNTEAEAQAIRQQLMNGADFATLAKKDSQDTGTADKGGDLGWFGKGVMDPAFEAAAFSLKVGDISQPVKSSFGYHIIEVLAKDPNRTLDPAQLASARDRAYQGWLSKQESDQKQVSYQVDANKMTWVQNYAQAGN
ncbi:MAG: peptidylprolyl isomerase [Chloroflexota bacterium]